jgi:hypothetical protein
MAQSGREGVGLAEERFVDLGMPAVGCKIDVHGSVFAVPDNRAEGPGLPA